MNRLASSLCRPLCSQTLLLAPAYSSPIHHLTSPLSRHPTHVCLPKKKVEKGLQHDLLSNVVLVGSLTQTTGFEKRMAHDLAAYAATRGVPTGTVRMIARDERKVTPSWVRDTMTP